MSSDELSRKQHRREDDPDSEPGETYIYATSNISSHNNPLFL
ncbi:MAG: hypothetical protein P8N94_07955 [Gammaproteobacteria bacterium]|nr:hypothetical protein [Gammaproteobacteria bacterium]MDG2337909.1 hypothetical protein [Gammaproteobacteria bacterium]